jgi:hypothetical protein
MFDPGIQKRITDIVQTETELYPGIVGVTRTQDRNEGLGEMDNIGRRINTGFTVSARGDGVFEDAFTGRFEKV